MQQLIDFLAQGPKLKSQPYRGYPRFELEEMGFTKADFRKAIKQNLIHELMMRRKDSGSMVVFYGIKVDEVEAVEPTQEELQAKAQARWEKKEEEKQNKLAAMLGTHIPEGALLIPEGTTGFSDPIDPYSVSRHEPLIVKGDTVEEREQSVLDHAIASGLVSSESNP
jgi:hypothetical protein